MIRSQSTAAADTSAKSFAISGPQDSIRKGKNMVEKKKRSSKIAIVLSLAIAAAALTPANVQAAKVPKKTVFYLSHKYNEYDTFYSESASFSISELKKSEYIKISSLKSSDESVVEATTVHGDYYFEKGSENRGWCSIACNYKKPGTAVVSYKTGNKKQS